jgi:DNA-binding CsgD family transcriptional regulator
MNYTFENTEAENFCKGLQEELHKLKEKCAFLERIINEVPANIYLSDLETGVYWCNKTNEQTLGYTLAEIQEMGGNEYFKKVVHPKDIMIPENSIQHYQNYTGPEFGGVFRAKNKNESEYKWYLGWAKAFNKDNQNKVKDLLCVDVDMSQQMNTDIQLVEALKENLKIKNKLLIKSLTKRELEILSLICKGVRTKQIGEVLCLSHHTIYTHRKNIQKKLGTANIADLVKVASEAGIS